MEAPQSGQSLIEMLFAVAIGAVLMIAGVSLIAPSLRTGQSVGIARQVAGLGSGLVDNLKVFSELDWHGLTSIATDTSSTYYLNTHASPFVTVPGMEQIKIGSSTYRRYFALSDVYRDGSGNATTTASGNTYDPSIKQATITVLPTNVAVGPLTLATSSWATTTALPQSPNNSGNGWANLVTINNCIYAIGGFPGAGTTPTTTIYYTAVAGVGKVGTWNKTTGIPQSSGFNGLVNVVASPDNGYLYMLGSGDPGTATTSVFYAKSNSDCTLGAWQKTTPLASLTNAGTLFVNNDYLYYVGGYNNSGNTDYAPINADGTIGAWTVEAVAPQSSNNVIWSSGAAYNNFLYIPGGVNDQGTATSTVFYAAVNTSGSLGSWQKTTPLPAALQGTAIALNGYLYVLAGDAAHKTAYYAPINPDGTVGSWTQGPNLPTTGYTLFDFEQIGNGILSVQPNSATVKTTVMAPPASGGTQFQTFLARYDNRGYDQTDWSGGPGQTTPVMIPTNMFATSSLSPAPPTTIHVAQTATGYESGTNKAFSVFPNAPSRGDLIVVAASVYSTSLSSITDTAGNAYTQIRVVSQSANGSTMRLYLYYAQNIATSSPFTVTGNLSSSGEATVIAIDLNGAATTSAFDSFASAIGIGATANSGNVTPAASGEMLIGASTDSLTVGETPAAGWTEFAAMPDNSNFQDLYVEGKIVSGTGATSATFTSSNGASMQWDMILGAFKSASIPGSSKDAIIWSNPGSVQLNL